MTATILLVALALGQAQRDTVVTDAEKKEFLDLLAKLPTNGEFFSDEAVTKAVPYTRVLLALTEKDLGQRDLYAILALSRGLLDRKAQREYGIKQFSMIAHPTIKLFWEWSSSMRKWFLRSCSPSFAGRLDSKDPAQTLAGMTGPGFPEFQERVLRTYERARQTRVELVKRYTIDAFPGGDKTFYYTKESCAIAPDQWLYACRPLEQHGELIAYNLAKGSSNRLAIPQPQGFQAKFDFESYFESPVLSINSRGDLFCRWTLQGNGDHALALLKKGSNAFRITRVDLVLADCFVAAQPEGDWYLIQSAPLGSIYQVDGDLKLTKLGEFPGKGQHTIGMLDARFIAKDVLHLFWGEVLSGKNHMRMRCVDLDVRTRKWSHNREIFRLDQFVSSADEPTVLQLEDGSLHYLWRVKEGPEPGEATGLYYQAESEGKTEKISSSYEYRAVLVGNLIVLCYTLAESPEKVFFRVINQGALGPVSEITAAPGRSDPLRIEYMILKGESDRIWFMNTLTMNALYELKLQDMKKP